MKQIVILLLAFVSSSDVLAQQYGYVKRLPLSGSVKRRINRPFDPTFERYKSVNYDYVYDWKRPTHNSVSIRLKTHNENVAKTQDVWVEVTYREMRHSKTEMTAIVPMTFDGMNGVATIEGLAPATVYQFGPMVFYRGNPQEKDALEKGNCRLASRTKFYYSVTDGDPNLPNYDLARARRNIVMGGFKEYYDWASTRINHTHKSWYTNGNDNWCGDFVRCMLHEHINVDHLDRRHEYIAFKNQGQIWGPEKVKKMAKAGHWIHGDYLKDYGSISGGHRGLLVAYDEDTGQFVYVDGNFGSRVGLHRTRRLPYDTIGHVVSRMIRTAPVIRGVPPNQFSIFNAEGSNNPTEIAATPRRPASAVGTCGTCVEEGGPGNAPLTGAQVAADGLEPPARGL